MALNQGTDALDMDQYQAAGMNALMPWWSQTAQQTNMAGQAGVPWHALVHSTGNGLTGSVISNINSIDASPGGAGWLVEDEPVQAIFPQVAEVVDYLKHNFPDRLIYTDAIKTENWDGYLSDLISTIQPDVLMYNQYPFTHDTSPDGSTKRRAMFEDLLTIRNKAQAANIPYFAFPQAFEDSNRRLPSESDMRMHVYSHLTAGFKGISYFAYHFTDIEHNGGLTNAMLDQNDLPTIAYTAATDMNPEIINLGQSLRFLDSTDIRFIAGKRTASGPLNRSPTLHLSDWSAGAGGNSLITDVAINHSASGVGIDANGLIGFFDDDAGQKYFMLTNIWHEADTSSADTIMTFTLDFDSNITDLLMLNRQTGQQEVVPLVNNQLTVSLPGGTGNLYKFNTGNFVGIPVPVPGDFNGDGQVDGDDLTGPNGWEERFGIDLTGYDFLIWQRNLGANVGASVAIIPEPTSTIMFCIGGMALLCRSRRFSSVDRLP